MPSRNRTTNEETIRKLVRKESSKTRNYKNFSRSDFEPTFNNTIIREKDDFKLAVQKLEKELTRTLDKLTPLEDRKKKRQPSRPWYSATLKEQRKIVRLREHIYKRDRQQHQWKAFTRECNRCTGMLEEATLDSRQLFQLVDTLLGCKEDNPLPETTSNSALVEDFVSFFHDKIDNIRIRFKDIPPCKPNEKCNVPLLRKFTPVSAKELEKTINSMPSKTCALDIMPTARLKEVLGTILPSLAHVVNKSLDQGAFYTPWKEALVKPLGKKTLLVSCSEEFQGISFFL